MSTFYVKDLTKVQLFKFFFYIWYVYWLLQSEEWRRQIFWPFEIRIQKNLKPNTPSCDFLSRKPTNQIHSIRWKDQTPQPLLQRVVSSSVTVTIQKPAEKTRNRVSGPHITLLTINEWNQRLRSFDNSNHTISPPQKDFKKI